MVSLIFVSGLASGFMVPIKHHGEAMKESADLKGALENQMGDEKCDEMLGDGASCDDVLYGAGWRGSCAKKCSEYDEKKKQNGSNGSDMNNDESELELTELRNRGVQLPEPESEPKPSGKARTFSISFPKIKLSFSKGAKGNEDENATNDVELMNANNYGPELKRLRNNENERLRQGYSADSSNTYVRCGKDGGNGGRAPTCSECISKDITERFGPDAVEVLEDLCKSENCKMTETGCSPKTPSGSNESISASSGYGSRGGSPRMGADSHLAGYKSGESMYIE